MCFLWFSEGFLWYPMVLSGLHHDIFMFSHGFQLFHGDRGLHNRLSGFSCSFHMALPSFSKISTISHEFATVYFCQSPMGMLMFPFGRRRVQEHSETSRGYVLLEFGLAAVLYCFSHGIMHECSSWFTYDILCFPCFSHRIWMISHQRLHSGCIFYWICDASPTPSCSDSPLLFFSCFHHCFPSRSAVTVPCWSEKGFSRLS